MGLPPLPAGATLVDEPRGGRRDLYDIAREAGFTVTNGYRTDGDTRRLRANGYNPAQNSDHNRGDAMDLIHPSWSPQRQEQWARENFPNARVLYHDRHLHLGMPGWGEAPGTPGSANSGLPSLPNGAQLTQRGSLTAPGNFAIGTPSPPPMSGDQVNSGIGVPVPPDNAHVTTQDDAAFIEDAARRAQNPADLDRILAERGLSILNSHEMFDRAGNRRPVGRTVIPQAPGAIDAVFTSAQDAAAAANGEAPPASLTPTGMTQTVSGQRFREMSGDRRGSIWVDDAGNTFTFFSSTGEMVPIAGQSAAQGGYTDPITGARHAGIFEDETSPVHQGRRILMRGSQGLHDLAAMPVDLLNGTMRLAGAPVSDAPMGGSQYFEGVYRFNDPSNAPRGPVEAQLQRGSYLLGSSAPITTALVARGGNLINTLGPAGAEAPIIGNGGIVSQSLNRLSVDTASNLGRTVRAELGASAGGAVAGHAAQEVAPNNPAAEGIATIFGALGGGAVGAMSGRSPASTARPAPGDVVQQPPTASAVSEPMGPAAQSNLTARASGAVANSNEDAIAGIPVSRAHAELDRHIMSQPDRSNPAAYEAWLTEADRLQAAADAENGWVRDAGGRIINGNDNTPRVEAMAREDGALPPQEVVSEALPPLPPGATMEMPMSPAAFDRPSTEDLAAVAHSVDPEDVLPRPSNRVRSLEEHIGMEAGRFSDVPAPNADAELVMRTIRSFGGGDVRLRGPMDAETFLRQQGGVRDQGGELTHSGITNNRARPEVTGEGRVGPIVRQDGLTLDEAGLRLYEAGYFPDHTSRPTVDDVLELLSASRRGERTFRPQELDEVQRHYDAQAQAHAVDAAWQEGAPLQDDASVPAGASRFDQEPPAAAYEDVTEVVRRAGNIDVTRLDSAEDIGRLLQETETAFGGFDAARRGTMRFDQTQRLSEELGMTAHDLLSRRHGQALNAEQALAARAILARSSDEVIELARRAQGGSELDRTAFAEALLRHAAIQEQVTGATAEAGRALSSLRIAAQSRAVGQRIHQIAADGMGGQQRLEDIASKILDLQEQGIGAGGINRFAANALKPRFRDMLVEIWYNSLLSGPTTHVVNTLSNSMTAALQAPEQVAASMIGQGRRALRSMRGEADDFDRVTFSELGPRIVGMMQGTREGMRAFGRTLRTGDVADHVTKVEARTQEAIPGVTGTIIRTPSRFLAAEDELFKGIAQRAELTALATRLATREGLTGYAARQRIQDIIANPPDGLLERSLDYARYQTFQRPLGPIGQRLMATTNDMPWLKLFIPFIRTPTNILKYGIERSPAAPVLREVRANLRAGGERQALAMSKMILGTGLGLTIMQMVDDGVITGGGPTRRSAENLLRADGWQPYSIRVGDTYYSYQRLDPLALTLGISADLSDYSSHMTRRQQESAGALLLTSILGNLENKTWLSGISDVLSAINQPDQRANTFAGRLAGSLAVPSILNQAARAIDPVQHDTRAPSPAIRLPEDWRMANQMLGSIQNRIPGASQYLEGRRDVFGNEMRSEGGLGPDAVSPIWTRGARNDPIVRELLSNMIGMNAPQRFLMHDGQRRDLTPEEYGRYQELAGRKTHEALTNLVGSREWISMDIEARQRAVKRLTTIARRQARAELDLDGSEDGEDVPLPPGATGGGQRRRRSPLPPLPPGATLPPLPPGAQPAAGRGVW